MDTKLKLASLSIMLVVSYSSVARQEQGDSRVDSVQGMIDFLHESRYDREALSIRGSNIGKKAPPVHVREWLVNRPNIEQWPTGAITVLEFWSITCGPCIASIPENNELAKWITSKGGLFVSLHSADVEKSRVSRFLETHPVSYAVAIDANSHELYYSYSRTFKEYGVDAIPRYVTIGKSGRVLSYKPASIQGLSRLIRSEPNHVDVPPTDAEIWALAARPRAWITADLKPKSKVRQRFLVYRPDTPELRLERRDDGDRTIGAKLRRHTDKSQTVYEVVLDANAPDWGQSIDGEITLIGKYSGGDDVITIPYQMKSRGLVEYPSSTVHLGLVRKGQQVTRTMTLRPVSRQENIALKTISVAPDVKLELEDHRADQSDIVLTFTLVFDKIGFGKKTVELSAFDGKGNRQSIRLDFSALVRE